MKTKELVNRINGDTVFTATFNGDHDIMVSCNYDDDDYYMMCIPSKLKDIHNIVLDHEFLDEHKFLVSFGEIGKLYELVKEYVNTPLKDRNDIKYYWVKVFNHDMGYLNYDQVYKIYIIADCDQSWERFKTNFTKTEIEGLKHNKKLRGINWNNVKLEEVED